MRIPLTKVLNSSNIVAQGYDAASKTLRVVFRQGGCYDYKVPEDVYASFVKAPSYGSFIASRIKGKFPTVQVPFSEVQDKP